MVCKSKTKDIKLGEFYAEYDRNSEMWCVFHTESDGFCYETHLDERSAQEGAKQKNTNI